MIDLSLASSTTRQSRQHNKVTRALPATMSLLCLSILGNKNEPLFFKKPPGTKKKEPNREQELDAFGFLESMDGASSSVDHEVCNLWSMLAISY
jgi:hypothetical protein